MSFSAFAVVVMLAMAGASSVEARGTRIVERFSSSATGNCGGRERSFSRLLAQGSVASQEDASQTALAGDR